VSAVRTKESALTAAVGEDTMLSVMIKVLRVSISLFCGYPKSIISVGGQTNVPSTSNATSNTPSISS